ncbi:RIB43A-like with coiled-coils protein 2 isoform X1 [Salvelinus sp. IW2-2015]|uniref:RIB43A-like with coiled-coils protein 2 isoform X1 n=1 Tax=Salvelinus sp. IW2-2015 TaxID=2691554 RepID=UPI000CDFA606|nr:RIB43A-like with coiled-coils protein 2 isoform X1 [Salvelinus alpinus]
MYNAELLSDRIATASLERRRNREMQRQDRIFNAKVRTIGIDKEALDSQVKERKKKEQAEAESLKAYASVICRWNACPLAADAVRNDKAACLLDQCQLKDERLLQGGIEDFRLNFQPRWSRREYDLSNPDKIRGQEGIQMLPGLVGEDPDSQGRLKKQQEQLREWSVQQQHELATARHQQRQEEQQYDQDRVDLDNKALQLQRIEEERRRTVALATKNFNLTKAAENAEKRWKEWQQQEEDNRTDILNQLQGELLRESHEQGISVPGLPRLRPDSYKGLTDEQLRHIINCQQQQIDEKRRIQAEQQQEELQQDRFRVASARTALLMERQQARINKQLRRTQDNTNAQLAEAHHEQKKYLEKVYTNIPDDSYFSQFNTSSR